ncbi:hypothetical protein [Plebeiibacterium sediminum]|uniref:Lipoprotein n=1 Tax=Plebeiibacterium sediminum TaxID=2992112 RepID=A0AAE3M3Q4_9BACT|nr:hypothetical protein [Plebeiobacterium sediminum]MCW3786518.1 hypothetical protein [Plebeiobacterium sediminum]
MIKKILLYSMFILMLCSCKDKGIGTPQKSPECRWNKNDDIHYQYIELKHPENISDLLTYSSVYPNSEYIASLLDIFGGHYEQTKSIIKVVVKANGCSGTTSKTTSYTKSNHSDLGTWSINNIYTPKNSKKEFEVKVEIKSGLHADRNGGEGYVVWTKSSMANQLDSPQSGVIQGVYKKVSNGYHGGIIKPKPVLMYKDGKYLKAIL